MGFAEDMERLRRDMKQLEIEYEQWFSGASPKPPVDTRRRVEDVIRRYNLHPPQNLAEQSLFQMHQSKFNTYSEMWNRRIRLKEEGRLPGAREADRPAKPAAAAEEVPARAALAPADKFREVFDQFVAARRKAGQDTGSLNFENFRQLLARQADQLLSKGGYKDVDFGVSVKDGKVTIVAKPKK